MSLDPARWNFTIWQGATFRHLLTLLDGDVDTEPKDLSNYTALLEIRAQPKDTTAIYTLSTENNRINLGGVNGTIELVIDAADTAAITWERGVYDLTITNTDPGGDTDALLFGGFRVRGV